MSSTTAMAIFKMTIWQQHCTDSCNSMESYRGVIQKSAMIGYLLNDVFMYAAKLDYWRWSIYPYSMICDLV